SNITARDARERGSTGTIGGRAPLPRDSRGIAARRAQPSLRDRSPAAARTQEWPPHGRERGMRIGSEPLRMAFPGEPGPFSEEVAFRLLGSDVVTVPRQTFDAAFASIAEDQADALLVPVENSLAGSVLRVYDLLLESELTIAAETILPVELHLIGCPGATLP